jgi:hypothetical protein
MATAKPCKTCELKQVEPHYTPDDCIKAIGREINDLKKKIKKERKKK